MPSLSVHLQRDEDHAGLPFHPSCPVCRRERLAGSLAGDELVSRRTQAKIAAGLLAFSGLGVPAAAGADPDSVTEGTAEAVEAPDQVVLDIGADTVELIDEATPPPDDADTPTEAIEDEVAVEQAQEVEALEPTPEMTGTADDVVVPPAEASPISEPDAVPPEPAEAPTLNSAAESAGIRAERSIRSSQAPERHATTTPDRTASLTVPAETQPSSSAAAPAPRTTRVLAGATSSQTKPGDRVHVVRRGESLWSIASDLLGEDASTAHVAREVSRLWELNEDRIATGSPDLLYAGTRLRLR